MEGFVKALGASQGPHTKAPRGFMKFLGVIQQDP